MQPTYYVHIKKLACKIFLNKHYGFKKLLQPNCTMTLYTLHAHGNLFWSSTTALRKATITFVKCVQTNSCLLIDLPLENRSSQKQKNPV